MTPKAIAFRRRTLPLPVSETWGIPASRQLRFSVTVREPSGEVRTWNVRGWVDYNVNLRAEIWGC